MRGEGITPAGLSAADGCRASLIVPLHNASATLPAVLPQLAGLPPDWEIVLVDDGSRDGSGELALDLLPRARLLTLPSCRGAAAARNAGVAESRGDLLVFVDSDVAVSVSTLQAMRHRLETADDLSAVFGAYSPDGFPDEPPVSRFRNLLHSFVHHRHAGPAQTFWTGLGAVRRQDFLAVGGFREDLPPASVEDVEFGFRLHSGGCRIELDPANQGVHWKCWTLRSMLITDIWKRAAVWTELGLDGRVPLNRLNTDWRQKAALVSLALLLACLFAHRNLLALMFAGLYAGTQWPFFGFVWRVAGAKSLAHALGLLPLHHVCCGAGLLLGTCRHVRRRFIGRLRI